MRNKFGTCLLHAYMHVFFAQVLQEMGVRDLFSQDKSDLRGMTFDSLYVSQFEHKCYMNVNEKGNYSLSNR